MRQLRIDQSITKKDQESLDRYLNEVRKFPVLTIEEESQLGRKILEGDESSVRLLVNSNLRFVISVAKKYEGQGLLLADLVSEGNLGLIKAAWRFDYTKGFKFISFAVWWIRQSMMFAIDQHRRIVRLPANQLIDIMDMRKHAGELEQRLERQPSLEEISEASGIDLVKLIAYQYSGQDAVSMDVPVDQDQPGLYSILEDDLFPSPDTGSVSSGLRLELRAFLAQLPEDEREILKLSYGFDGAYPLHLEDIASSRDICIQTARAYINKALKRLRENVQFEHMRQYL